MSKKAFSPAEIEQLANLANLPDEAIDTADIPEAPVQNWVHARRGELYRPLKRPVTIRLDADILAWFREHAPEGGYQTEINRVLRRHVADAEKRRG